MPKDSLEFDILKEIFNIGVGKEADMLSQMLDKKIVLDVPSIQIIESNNADFRIEKDSIKGIRGALMVSSISFRESLNGEASLIFPAEKMRNIINLCLGEEIDLNEDVEFTDIDFDVIREIGNIILNSIIGEMGNFLNKRLEYTIPNVNIFEVKEFEDKINDMDDIYSLLLIISFLIGDTEIEGAVIINFLKETLKEIIKTVNKMEDDLYG